MIARLSGAALLAAILAATAIGVLAFFAVIGVFGEMIAIASLVAAILGGILVWRAHAAREVVP